MKTQTQIISLRYTRYIIRAQMTTVSAFFIGQIFLIVYLSVSTIHYFCTYNKDSLKLIGGSIVILVSLYAQSATVYVFAVIISGLIIASEKFMSLLVAILKADKSFLVSDNFSKMLDKMSSSEIAAKEQDEMEEIETTKILSEAKAKVPFESKKKDKDKLIASMLSVEMAALDKLEKAMAAVIKRQVKFGSVLLDGVLENRNGITYFIEVKYFPLHKGDISERRIAQQIETRVKHFIPRMLLQLNNEVPRFSHFDGEIAKSRKFVLLMVIVVQGDIDLRKIMERVSDLKQIYNSSNQKVNLKFVFYNGSKLQSDSELLSDSNTYTE